MNKKTLLRKIIFNARVAGTTLLIFLILMATLVEIIVADDFNIIVYKSMVFVLVLIFGILLIGATAREIKQRSQIERLAKGVQDSYELEKKAYQVQLKARQELENLDKTKNQFLLLIQHNLRAPLTSMMGYSDLLVNGALGKQTKKTTEAIKKFQVSTKSLIKMVNDFLDITQFQLGKEVLRIQEGIALQPMLSEIIFELKDRADAKKIDLKLEIPRRDIVIRADREKLKAALANIIDNAIKYTPTGGVTVAVKNHDNIKIIVSDTGIGISKEQLATLFTRIFERGEQAKRVTQSGSGVGLYLASQIIRYHGGKVWATSSGEGRGSVFCVELPLGVSGVTAPANDLEHGQPNIKNV